MHLGGFGRGEEAAADKVVGEDGANACKEAGAEGVLDAGPGDMLGMETVMQHHAGEAKRDGQEANEGVMERGNGGTGLLDEGFEQADQDGDGEDRGEVWAELGGIHGLLLFGVKIGCGCGQAPHFIGAPSCR